MFAGGWEGAGMGSYCLTCIGFQFYKMKSDGDGWWWLRNIMNVFNIPNRYTLK